MAIDNKIFIATTLRAIQEKNEFPSRYILTLLEDRGFVQSDYVKGEGRGRPRRIWNLSGKGRGYVALSKNWKSLRSA